MPSKYAHHRFGNTVLKAIPAPQQRQIQRLRRLYNIGQQGPDLFFYDFPQLKQTTKGLARQLHHLTGAEFFTRACANLKAHPSEGGTVYLYGLLCHYCLDSRIHPLVHELTDESPLGHVELETEFDRYLLQLDGEEKPQNYRMVKYFKITRGECVTVSQFYPPVTPGTVRGCTRNMVRADWFLTGKNRKLVKSAVKLLPEPVDEYFMESPANSKCMHLNGRMSAVFEEAAAEFPGLLEQLTDHMENGTPLGEDFFPIFG